MTTAREHFTPDPIRTCYSVKGDTKEKIEENTATCFDLLAYCSAAVLTMMIPCDLIIQYFMSLKYPNIYSVGYMNSIVECGCCLHSDNLKNLLKKVRYARVWLLAKGVRSALPNSTNRLCVNIRERNFIHTQNYHFVSKTDDERWMSMMYGNFLDCPPDMKYVRMAIDNIEHLKQRLVDPSFTMVISSYKNYARIILIHILNSDDYEFEVVKQFYSYFSEYYSPLCDLMQLYPTKFRIFFRKPIEINIFLGIDHVRFGNVKGLFSSPRALSEILDKADDDANYIKQMKERIELLKAQVKSENCTEKIQSIILKATNDMDQQITDNTNRQLKAIRDQRFVHQLLIRAVGDIDGHIRRMSAINTKKFEAFFDECIKGGLPVDLEIMRPQVPLTFPPGLLKFIYHQDMPLCGTEIPEGFSKDLSVPLRTMMDMLCSPMRFE